MRFEGEYAMKESIYMEVLVFIAFSLFYLHRIWGLIARNSYTGFWMDVLDKGIFYFALTKMLAVLYILGIALIKNMHRDSNFLIIQHHSQLANSF